MGQMMMVKRQCACGEWDRVTIIKGETAHIPFYYVKCPGCGRQTLKHRKAEHAILEWNHAEDDEDEQHGSETKN